MKIMCLFWLILYPVNLGVIYGLFSASALSHQSTAAFYMNVILCSFTVFLFVYVCTEQPRTTWCVTSCVRTQGVGVPAQTNASPANTSAVDEPVWIPVIFMKGELCLSMHTYTLMQQHRHPMSSW